MAQLIDPDMPGSAAARSGFDGLPYELVFPDEFNTANRTFWPGDEPFWEAVNIRHGSTGDQEWYGPAQITTRDGTRSLRMTCLIGVVCYKVGTGFALRAAILKCQPV
ncbi:SKN1-domain-containing protein [Suillus hirtellus]|nr:SKN1-domain-containing protein [Suillus hirtellus]